MHILRAVQESTFHRKHFFSAKFSSRVTEVQLVSRFEEFSIDVNTNNKHVVITEDPAFISNANEGTFTKGSQINFSFTDLTENSNDGLILESEIPTDIVACSLYKLDDTKFHLYLRASEQFINFEIITKSIIACLGNLVEWDEECIDNWNWPKFSATGRDCTIAQIFEEISSTRANYPAIIVGNDTISYEQLNIRVNQMVYYLKSQNVQPRSLIAISLDRGLNLYLVIIACFKIGATYIPLDPRLPAERRQFIVKDSGAEYLILDRVSTDIHYNHIKVIELSSADIPGQRIDNPCLVSSPGNLAYIVYTSGSTGNPKGVLIEERGVVNMILGQIECVKINSNDRVLQFASYGFDASVWEMWGCWAAGATLVVCPGEEKPLMGNELADFIADHKVTVATLVPSVLQLLDYNSLPTVRILTVTGEICHPHLARLWTQSGRLFVNGYGPTEGTVATTLNIITNPPDNSITSIPIGIPMPNIWVDILDEFLQKVPMGTVGEIYIGGAGVARGYLNNPELTAHKFVSGLNGEKYYRSGDLGKILEDGRTIEYHGRIDDQVKVNGVRIETGEIEVNLLAIDAIKEAAVVFNSGSSLVAHLVLKKGMKITKEELRNILQNNLPDYMLPNAYVFAKELPLTTNGKVDKKALSSMTLPMSQQIPLGPENIPKAELEIRIARVWESVLQSSENSIGLYDNFFQKGGNSLLAVKLVMAISADFNVQIPAAFVFRNPLLTDMVNYLSRSATTEITGAIETPLSRNELSFAQQAIWLHMQQTSAPLLYNQDALVKIHYIINVEVFKAALLLILDRHADSLKKCIVEGELKDVEFDPDESVNFVDLRSLTSDTEKNATFLEIQNTMLCKPFKLDGHNPLIRFALIYYTDSVTYLHITFHHIIMDGESLVQIFIPELAQCYAAHLNSKVPTLPSLSAIQNSFNEKSEEFWDNYLNGFQNLNLPTDFTTGVQNPLASSGGMYSFPLQANLVQVLNTLTRECSTTLFTTLFSSFNLFLSEYTNSKNILIGTAFHGRSPANYGRVGNFAYILPVRSQLQEELTFSDFVKVTRDNLSEVYEEAFSFSNQSGISFDATFIWRSAKPRCTCEWNVSQGSAHTSTAKFPISLVILEKFDGTLVAQFEYLSTLWKKSTIERMMDNFITLLRNIGDNPEGRLPSFSIISESEAKLFSKWNQTVVDFGDCENGIQSLVENSKFSTSVAISFDNEKLTYEELNYKSDALARQIRQTCLSSYAKGQPIVAILLSRGPSYVISMLATLKAAGAYVPLDPSYPKDRLSFVLEDCKADVIITNSHFLDMIAELNIETINIDLKQEGLNEVMDADLQYLPSASSLMYIIYTSGSTGKPKGVQVTHKNVFNCLKSLTQILDLDSTLKILALTTFSFDIAVLEIFLPLILGGQVVLAGQGVAADADKVFDLLLSSNSNFIQATPTHWKVMAGNVRWGNLDLSGVKALCGGEPLPTWLANEIAKKVGKLWNMYGPTETTIWSTIFCVSDNSLSTGSITPIGFPLANTTVHVLNNDLKNVPIGAVGELYIGGDGVTNGYLNRPTLQADAFVNCQFRKTLLYRSGDLVRYTDSGSLEFISRVTNDSQVKIRGYRVEIDEIEFVLLKIEWISEAVVLVKDDNLVAYLITRKSIAMPRNLEICLRQELIKWLPAQMIPTSIVFLDKFPTTLNGKLDKKALVEMNSNSGDFECTSPVLTEIEFKLAKIWANVLKCPPKAIRSPFINFFELGGHSLLAIKLLSAVNVEFNVQVQFTEFMLGPTISNLIKLIEKSTMYFVDTIYKFEYKNQIKQNVPFFLSHSQRQIWHHHTQLGNQNHHALNVTACFTFKGPLNQHALEQALTAILKQQSSWRILLQESDHSCSFPNQIVTPFDKLPISYHDEIPDQLFSQDFDVCKYKNLLIHFYVKTSAVESKLVVVAHHLITDGISMHRIFLNDLRRFYTFYSQNGSHMPVKLDLPSRLEYSDFVFNEQGRFEKSKLLNTNFINMVEKLKIFKTIYFKNPESDYADRLTCKISEDLLRSLHEKSRLNKVSLYTSCLTAFSHTMAHFYANPVFGIVESGRAVEWNDVIGCFINILLYECPPSVEIKLNSVNKALISSLQANCPISVLAENLNLPVNDVYPNVVFSMEGGDMEMNEGRHNEWNLSANVYPRVEEISARFDLLVELEILPGMGGMRSVMEFRKSVFKREQMYQLESKFREELEYLVMSF